MKKLPILLAIAAVVAMSSCVSMKKYKTSKEATERSEKNYTDLQGKYNELQNRYAACMDRDSAQKATIATMQKEYKENSNQMMNQLKDLSVISTKQAESISKSLDNIGVKDEYIKNLQTAMNRKDSMNMALVINLKSAIGNIDDKDINIKVDKGVVYVDISDKLLFTSGQYTVTTKAQDVLGKVAKVLAAQPDVEFMVEGHTDNVPYSNGLLEDNWDLSVKRATAVIRILQKKYGLNPARMVAGGRGEYAPVSGNDDKDGRASNRRTRIVIIPKLDQFFQLLEKPKG